MSTLVIDEAKIGGSQPRPRDSVGWLTGSIAQLQMSMSEYQYTPETCHDPVVSKGEFLLPMLRCFDGVGKIIYPSRWAKQKAKRRLWHCHGLVS